MKLRIRWSRAARFLTLGALALLSLRLAPTLLQPPAPEKLPKDVGLSGVVKPSHERPPRLGPAPLRRSVGRVAWGRGHRRRAEAAEGNDPKQRVHRPSPRSSAQHKPRTPTPRQDPPAATPVPEPVPSPAPEVSAPEQPPPAPEDGSVEFAPH